MLDYLKNFENYPVIITITLSILGVVGFFIKRWFFKDHPQYTADIKIDQGETKTHAYNFNLNEKERGFIDFIVKQRGITNFAYFCDIPSDSYAILHFSFRVSNNEKSTTAAKNVQIRLEYPAENIVDEKSLLEFKGSVAFIELKSSYTKNPERDYFQNRELNVVGDKAQVCFNISLLRPGEKIIMYEIFKIKNTIGDKTNHPIITTPSFRPEETIKELLKIDNFLDYFKIKIFIYAENCATKKKEYDIYCFRGTNEEDAAKTLKNLTGIFWKTKDIYLSGIVPFLKIRTLTLVKQGGLIWIPPFSSSFNFEYISEPIEVYIPSLKKEREKIYFCICPEELPKDLVIFRYAFVTEKIIKKFFSFGNKNFKNKD